MKLENINRIITSATAGLIAGVALERGNLTAVTLAGAFIVIQIILVAMSKSEK